MASEAKATSVRLEPKIHAAVMAYATATRRSFTASLNLLLEEAFTSGTDQAATGAWQAAAEDTATDKT